MYSHAGEGGVKRLSKAVDSAVGNIGGILVDHLQPSLQAAAFKLNELHSLAKCTHQLLPLGLQVCHVACSAYPTAPPTFSELWHLSLIEGRDIIVH